MTADLVLTVGSLAAAHAEHKAPRSACLFDFLEGLGIDPDLPVATVQRWIASGPKWDRLLADTLAASSKVASAFPSGSGGAVGPLVPASPSPVASGDHSNTQDGAS